MNHFACVCVCIFDIQYNIILFKTYTELTAPIKRISAHDLAYLFTLKLLFIHNKVH